MATNVWPRFNGGSWSNNGASILSQDSYSVFFTASEAWVGLRYTIPDDWKGKYITVGCAGLSGGAIYFLDSGNNNVVTPIEKTEETTFALPTTAVNLYVMSDQSNATIYIDGIYLYVGESAGGDSGGDSGGGDGTVETVNVTLRPTSASGSNWSNANYAYDGQISTAATVSATSSNYTSRVLTCSFSTSSIPKSATIKSAVLTTVFKQSSSTSTRRYTPYVDINGSSSNRVISEQINTALEVTFTADILSYMSSLQTITISPYRQGTSSSNTLSLYEIYIDVTYEIVLGAKVEGAYLGSTKISDIYLGSTPILRVFLGDELVYGDPNF